MHMFLPGDPAPRDTSERVFVCDGPICRFRGRDIEPYRNAADQIGATLRITPCLGACFSGPVAGRANGEGTKTFYRMDDDRARQFVEWITTPGSEPPVRVPQG